MEGIVRRARDAGTEVLVLDEDRIFGRDHLAAALYHASRAIDEGTNASESLLMETILYASGERQLGLATKKMGVSKDSSELVVAKLADGVFEPDSTWADLPAVQEPVDRARLAKFGISDAELATIGKRPPAELVLEKVAAVDILKR